jgi:hypothetical protein
MTAKYRLDEHVVPAVGTPVVHKEWGWKGRVGYGSTSDQVAVLWLISERETASLMAYRDVEVRYDG